MFTSIVWPSWDQIFHGEVSFQRFGEIISDMFSELVGHEFFTGLYDPIAAAVGSLTLPIFVVLAILSLALAARGRRLLPLVSFVAFFALGFLFGTSAIAPLILDSSATVVPWIIGAALGLILAILAKHLYKVVYILFFGYSAYMIFMGGQLLPESIVGFTKDNMIMALFAVCITVVLVFLLRTPVEIIGTGVLGGYLFSLCFDALLLNAFAIDRVPLASNIVMAVVALFGIVSQAKCKKSKKVKEKKVKVKKAKKK